MTYDFTHVDPDLVPILTDLDARLTALGPGLQGPPGATGAQGPAGNQGPQGIPGPAFDTSTLNAQLASLDARIVKLEGTPVPIPPLNHPPVWTTLPNVIFKQGVAASFSFAPFVSDADIGDVVTLTFSGSLPAGITFDGPGKRLVYDGIGAVGTTSGNFLIADDGRP